MTARSLGKHRHVLAARVNTNAHMFTHPLQAHVLVAPNQQLLPVVNLGGVRLAAQLVGEERVAGHTELCEAGGGKESASAAIIALYLEKIDIR